MKYNTTVILAGAGPISDETFDVARNFSDIFVGVDGGADALLTREVMPDAVIGDMDSLSAKGRAAIAAERVVPIAEQETTDFDKALRSVAAPLILAIGFTGARLDHELAALHSLLLHHERPVILIGEEDITLHLPRELTLELPLGLRLSLFPLDEVRVTGTGLAWAVKDLALHPARRIGTSNKVAEPVVHLSTDAPGLLLILPRPALGAVIRALKGVDFSLAPLAPVR